MYGASIDHRVKTFNPLSFQFSLKLHQYIYDVEANTATPVIIAQNPPVNNPVVKSLYSIFQASSTPPSTPRYQTSPTNTSAPNDTSMPSSFSSPAMKLFLASTRKSDKTKKDYYGGMHFLDNQEEFTRTFGSHPNLMLSKSIDNDNGLTVSMLQN